MARSAPVGTLCRLCFVLLFVYHAYASLATKSDHYHLHERHLLQANISNRTMDAADPAEGPVAVDTIAAAVPADKNQYAGVQPDIGAGDAAQKPLGPATTVESKQTCRTAVAAVLSVITNKRAVCSAESATWVDSTRPGQECCTLMQEAYGRLPSGCFCYPELMIPLSDWQEEQLACCATPAADGQLPAEDSALCRKAAPC